MSTHKASIVLRRAAHLVETGMRFSCWALASACGRDISYFDCLMEDNTLATAAGQYYVFVCGQHPQISMFEEREIGCTVETQDHRVTALCLAAAIAESEGK